MKPNGAMQWLPLALLRVSNGRLLAMLNACTC